MSSKSQPPFSHRTKALVPLIFLCLCSLPRPCVPWASHEYSSSIFQRYPLEKRADAPARTEAGHCARRAAETSPALAGGGSGKEKHPEMLGKTFLPTWCNNTAHASAGVTLAVGKPWALAGIRWLVLKHVDWRMRIKRTKPMREANLTLSASSSMDMSLEKQPISNSWF